MIRAEPGQTGVDLVHQMVPADTRIVGPLAHRAHRLGGDHHVRTLDAQRLDRPAGELLRLALGIDVGGIDEVDPGIQRLLDEGRRSILIKPGYRAEPPRHGPECHCPEAQFRNNQTCRAETVKAHGNLLCANHARRSDLPQAQRLTAAGRVQGRIWPVPRTSHL